MDEFCGSEFWDPDRTWFTTNPDFTPCFQKTVLVWLPCGFLWLFAASDVYYSVTAKARAVPWSSLSVGKYIITLALMLLDVIRLGYWISGGNGGDVPEVEIYAPLEKIVTFTLYLVLLHYSRYKGVQSSGVQFLFWLLLTLCEAFAFRTIISQPPEEGENPSMSIVQIMYFPLVVGNFLLNCWADVRPLYEQSAKLKDRPCPEHGSSYLSRVTFSWFDKMAWNGWRRPLVNNDLWSLNSEDASRTIVPIFDHFWSKRVDNARKANAKSNKGGYTVPPENISSKGAQEPASIVPVLLRSFGGTFFFGASLKIIPDMLAFVSPQILNLLINFTSSNEELWKGYLYAVVLFFAAFFQTVVTAQYTHRMYLTAMRVRTVLVSAIYRKALLMSNAAKKESTVGEIVNLMSVDVQRIMDTLPFINLLWSAPLQIGVAVYFLWQELGPASLAGLAVMVLLIPVNAVIAGKVRQLQMAQLKHKDKRVKMMNEILSGVKVLKLYAWEPSFEDQVLAIRAKEMETLKSAAYLNAVTNFLWTCAPFLVSVSTFATYVLMDSENVLDPQKAFVSLSLFNIMNLPLTMLPMIIIFVVQSVVSINRINAYMNKEEIDPEAVEHNPNEGETLLIDNGTFAWESGTTVLRNINFRVKEGSLVAVVGSVGAGKSSLLSALLGELEKSSGRVNTRGSIGYVAQQAWIQNATLRDNILFGKHYDPARYDKIISACALKPDLDILPGRDRTEIGEKGINLSGGQKQRISLARSVYNNADVYLFDDPLSAVDSHVGKHIFDKVLGPKGLLKKKTRVLVTHGISFLPQCDNIFVLKDGEVSEVGSYQELLDKKGAFADFLSQHVTPEDIDEDPNLAKDLESVVGNVEELRRRRLSRETSRGPDSESEAEGTRKRRHVSSSSKIGGSVESLHKPGENKTDLIEKEKAETESVKLSVYVDYFRAAGWSMTVSTFILYLLFQVCAVGSNLWLSEWSQEPVVNGTTDPARRDMYLGVYAGLGITQALFIFAGTMVMALGTLKSSQVFHVSMLNRIMRSPMSFFDTTPIGRIVNRFAKDIDVADNTLPFNIRLWLNGFFQVAATLAVISYSTPIFLVVIVPIGIVYYLVQKIYVSSSRQLKRMESVTRSPIYSHFGETISGAPTIRAYSQQERFILESELRVDNNQVSYFPSIVANRWLAVRLETVGNLVIFFAAVFAVVAKDTLDPGIVGLSVSYALQITMSLMMLVRWTSDVETNIVAIERLQEYVEAPQEAPWNIPDKKPPTTWPHQGVVEFQKYQTRYRPGLDLVLRDVTCKIDGGEKIGIVGRTGAGKSSLTLALFRIVEAAGGHIKIDGQNIANLGLHDVRGRITIIPQDPVLFSGTLRVNLDPFNKYQDATIWKALELAHLKVFVKGLTAGLEHEIAEGGENLSVGQRQLVCLARALLRKTKILVLDEATAAVDLETDDLIQKTIRQEFADSTVITIAHRLNTIMDSTRVMVLDQGRIAEFDSPDALVQDSNSIFHSMAKDANLT